LASPSPFSSAANKPDVDAPPPSPPPLRPPLAFEKYIAEVGPTLAPPVANKMLFGDGHLKVMVVGGPNTRMDDHLQVGSCAGCAPALEGGRLATD
jgi:hypothetical protein